MAKWTDESAAGERSRFARFAESASVLASSSAFFAFCLMLVASFVAVMVIGLSLSWKLFVVDLMTVVSLLLLALLKNSERRAERAIQLKLNVIAAALLEQREGKTHQAHDDLKRAIGIEEQA